MRVCVVGLGYVGLPMASLLASRGVEVIGVDLDEEVVKRVNNAEIFHLESQIADLLKGARESGRLKAQMNVVKADVYIIAVPTPLKEDKRADLSCVYSAIRDVAEVISQNCLIVIESTCPVGTTSRVVEFLKQIRSDLKFPDVSEPFEDQCVRIAYCPERVLPGKTIEELESVDRLIGGFTGKCSDRAYELYSRYTGARCVRTDSKTAELCKLIENSYRDLNIAFANEVSMICATHEIDTWKLIELANLHPRVDILQPGPGVGGHCIAVDPWFVCETNENETALIRTAREVNDYKPSFVLAQIVQAVEDLEIPMSEVVVSCFGLTFKKDISDLRQSPALDIVSELLTIGCKEILICEPHIEELPDALRSKDCRLVSLEIAIEMGSIYVVLVDHKEFANVEISEIKGIPIVDTRGVWAPRL